MQFLLSGHQIRFPRDLGRELEKQFPLHPLKSMWTMNGKINLLEDITWKTRWRNLRLCNL